MVCCTSAGSLATIDGLAETFPPGPHGGPGTWGARTRAEHLVAAIERARVAQPDQQRAAALSASSSWDYALRAELTPCASSFMARQLPAPSPPEPRRSGGPRWPRRALSRR